VVVILSLSRPASGRTVCGLSGRVPTPKPDSRTRTPPFDVAHPSISLG
jgi:hypothetical protein